jgi:hypothetical protein
MDPAAELAKLQAQPPAKAPTLSKPQATPSTRPPLGIRTNRKQIAKIFLAFGAIALLIVGVLVWIVVKRGASGEPSLMSQVISKASPAAPPFKIERDTSPQYRESEIERREIALKIVAIADRPFSVYRCRFNGDHDAIPARNTRSIPPIPPDFSESIVLTHEGKPVPPPVVTAEEMQARKDTWKKWIKAEKEAHSLPLKLAVGEEAFLLQKSSLSEDAEEWDKPNVYEKRIIFVDFDTDVGNYRYTVDTGEVKAR